MDAGRVTDWNEVDEVGDPVHLLMGLDINGNGPTDDSAAHHWGCWCLDRACPGPPGPRPPRTGLSSG